MTDDRRSAPHVARNSDAIIDVLRGILPDKGTVLEVASGSGEHILRFAAAFSTLQWQPSDPDPVARRSIEAWRASERPSNLLAPLELDASSSEWPRVTPVAILCINMVHISPWSATVGLMRNAGQLLAPGETLYLYGAYRRYGVQTAPSNEAFDLSLKSRNPGWGIRRLEDVVAEAERNGLALQSISEMPANNLSVVFRRS